MIRVKTVTVAVNENTSALEPQMLRITLPAAPWEDGWSFDSRPKGTAAVLEPNLTGVCRVPGCTRKLARSNVSGVCWLHHHKPGYCGCNSCRKRAR